LLPERLYSGQLYLQIFPAEFHFGTEENYFESFKYNQSDEHIKEHKKFIKSLKDFQSGYNTGKLVLDEEFVAYLMSWFTDHINSYDMKYVDLFKDNGVN